MLLPFKNWSLQVFTIIDVLQILDFLFVMEICIRKYLRAQWFKGILAFFRGMN